MLAEPRTAPTDAPTARAEFACWLADGILAVAGWCADGPAGDHGLPHLAVRSTVFARDETGDAAIGFLAVATGVASLERAVLDLDGRCAVLDPARVEMTDAESLAWFGLAGVGAEIRTQATDLLAATMNDVAPGWAAARLGVELRRFRD